METIWFVIVWSMLAAYIVLDGFDLGAGAMNFFVAKTDAERRAVLAAIGPFWDANEVWLIAAGGVLFMAFPRTYAVAFSGFYLALIILLWLLILRGVAIEFRSHQESLLGRQFWDGVFAAASATLAVIFGATIGNIVRGVPLDKDGLPGMALFTSFQPTGKVGVFDWYTSLVGLFALFLLAGHGALFLVWRTTGAIQVRSRTCARKAWAAAAVLWAVVTAATGWVRPELFAKLASRPWSLAFLSLALGSLWSVFHFLKAKRELPAFLSSCAFVLGLLGTALVGIYPAWLHSTLDTQYSLTVSSTMSSGSGLLAALGWSSGGILLAACYFVFLFRTTSGKVDARDYGQVENDLTSSVSNVNEATISRN